MASIRGQQEISAAESARSATTTDVNKLTQKLSDSNRDKPTIEVPFKRSAVAHSSSVGGRTGKMFISFAAEGRPAELLISMDKESVTVNGFVRAFCDAVSVGLQYGASLSLYIEEFAHTRFEPSGWSRDANVGYAKSLYDYMFRWLEQNVTGPESDDSTAGLQHGASDAGSSGKTRKLELPVESLSIANRFDVGGHQGTITVSLFLDGSPGAISMHLAKEGSRSQVWLTVGAPQSQSHFSMRYLCPFSLIFMQRLGLIRADGRTMRMLVLLSRYRTMSRNG